MSRFSPQLRILMAKELRQVRRSKGALASATILPLLLMTIMPLLQLITLRDPAVSATLRQSSASVPPPMAQFGNDPAQFFVHVMLPMLLILGGLIVPSVSATHTIVAEREKRSLELLMALPARVSDILVAKLLAMLVLAVAVVLPLFTLDMLVLLGLGLVAAVDVVILLALLLAALAYSVAVALLLALLARDFRTANNLNGAFLVPVILAVVGLLFGLPTPLSYVLLGALLLAAAAAAVQVGLRWLTFERYLA
jgi:ABC-2 type transport system permease protein